MSEIRSRPSTTEYREGWDRVFGDPEWERRVREAFHAPITLDSTLPAKVSGFPPLNPNDAHEHPPAD